MSKVVVFNCPSCRAALPALEEDAAVTCAYCGREVLVEHGHAQGAGETGEPGEFGPSEAQVAASRKLTRLLLVVALLGVAGTAFFSLLVAGGGQMARPVRGVGAGGHVPSGEHMQWSGWAGVPVPISLAGDEVEDFLGFYTVLEGERSPRFIGAFDGETFERRWGHAIDAQVGIVVPLAVVAGRVLLGNGSAAQVLDLQTGKLERQISLPDIVDFVCIADAGPPRAWVRAKDGSERLIDLQEGEVTHAPPPEGCSPAPPSGVQWGGACPEGAGASPGSARCVEADRARLLPLPGMDPTYWLIAGDDRVLIGGKSPGTARPMAAGLGADGAVRWSTLLASGGPADVEPSSSAPADLAGHRLVAITWPATEGARLLALDAREGTKLWEVFVPGSKDGRRPEALRATPTRVYVPHWTWLEVFDARDGRHLATIGMW